MIRNGTIEKTTGWNNYSGSTTAATIYSILQVSAQAATTQVDGSGGNIVDTDTFVLDAITFTFVTTPAVSTDVEVGVDSTATILNLSVAIHEVSSDYFTEVSGDQLVIKSRTTGDGVTIVTDDTNATNWVSTANDTLGNNGALAFEGETFDISIDGAATATVTLSGYATTDDNSSIATTIALTAGITANAVGTDRVEIVHSTVGATSTLEITDVSGTTLFEEGFYEGQTAQHPHSDTATTKIQLLDPSDPAYFRALNRPLIGLVANDKEIYREIVALRDGYDIENGTEIASASHLARFKAAGGLHVDTNLHVYGDLILHGEPVTQTAETLVVTDNTIILNYGETGSGVTDNGGVAGIYVDRGTLDDSYLRWNETNSAWEFSGDVSFPENVEAGKAVLEDSQITIGDGVNTFGHFEGVELSSLISAALADPRLASGGKIYVKRGNYTWTGSTTIVTDNISIVGEGSATQVTVDLDAVATSAITVSSDESLITMIKFVTNNGAASVYPVINYASGSQLNILEKVWFLETGSDSVDITHVMFDDNLLTNCISQTNTTNLP